MTRIHACAHAWVAPSLICCPSRKKHSPTYLKRSLARTCIMTLPHVVVSHYAYTHVRAAPSLICCPSNRRLWLPAHSMPCVIKNDIPEIWHVRYYYIQHDLKFFQSFWTFSSFLAPTFRTVPRVERNGGSEMNHPSEIWSTYWTMSEQRRN